MAITLCFPAIDNDLIKVHNTSGNGAYFAFKNLGVYRIILHAGHEPGFQYALELKSSDGLNQYRIARGSGGSQIEIIFTADNPQGYYMLVLTPTSDHTLYSDPIHCWIEFEYISGL